MSEPSEELKPVRKMGRPARHREKLDLPKVIDIPMDGDPALIVLPCSPERQANDLDWYKDEVLAVNEQLGMYRTIPMTCRGKACFWAEMCPTKAGGFLYKGFRCPIEIMEIHRQFVLLVQALHVTPEDSVDLNHIADLIRLDVHIKRIDMQLQVDGMMTEQVAGIAQKTGEPVHELGAHPMISVQDKLAARRDRIYKQLLLSREAREKMRLAEGKNQLHAADILTRLKEMATQMNGGQGTGHLAGIGGTAPGVPGAVAALPAGPINFDPEPEPHELEHDDEDDIF